jgi:hypothetical protein
MADLNYYLSEAEKNYAPTRASIQNQINAIPGQLNAAVGDVNKQYSLQQQELDRQQSSYNNNTSRMINNRGFGFSNAGQNYAANYAANTYRPAVTNLQTNQQNALRQTNENYTNRRYSLENTMNSLVDEQRRWAMEQYQRDQDRAAQEQAARAAAAAAAQQSALASYFNNGAQGTPGPTYRDWLQGIANSNTGGANGKFDGALSGWDAQQLLNYVGNDFVLGNKGGTASANTNWADLGNINDYARNLYMQLYGGK